MPKENNTIGEHEIFATRLRGLVDKQGITHQQLADELNVTRQAVSSYYFGKRQPNFQKLIEIAEYFDVSTDYLLGLSEFRNYDEIREIKQSAEVFEQIKDPLVLEDMKETFKRLGEISRTIETQDISRHLKAVTDSMSDMLSAYRKNAEKIRVNNPFSKMEYLEFKALSTDRIDEATESIRAMGKELGDKVKAAFGQGDEVE